MTLNQLGDGLGLQASQAERRLHKLVTAGYIGRLYPAKPGLSI